MTTFADDSNLSPPARSGERERAWHEWMMVAVGLIGLLAVMAIIVSVVALSSTNPSTTPAMGAGGTMTMNGQPPGRSAAAPATTTAPAERVTLSIKADSEHGRLGPDHQWHDAFLPADFTVQPGATVTVTVLNYDSGPHTFTAPRLNVNAIIPGGSLNAPQRVTFKFTAPSKPGRYAWMCMVPCDPWAMDHDGYMRGYVTVAA